MLTVWLAITDATVDNGCLIAVEGSHRRDSTLHCPSKVFSAEIYIPDSIIDHDRGGRARSKTVLETALTDADEWANLWWDARSRIASSEVEVGFDSRWARNAKHLVCA
jgi:hypothetical protein